MSRLLDLLFPRRCPVCKRLLPFGESVCTCQKWETLRVPDTFCEHCGAAAEACSCALARELKLPHVTAPYYYTGAVRRDLLELKFHGAHALAGRLGREMALCFTARYAGVRPDLVTAVPMSKKSRRQRGFNQSELLAKETAAQLRLPFVPLLQKTRETEQQHKLSEQARRTNLKHAFALLPAAVVQGKTVLLVDDIKTTGATLSECVRVLEENGAAAVYCLCCAVTDFAACR